VLADRIGERNTVVASMVLAAVALSVIVLAPAFPLFVLGLVLFGFGTGLYGTPRITVLSDIYPDRAATAISINSAVGNVGNAAFPVVATVVAGWFAWRTGVGVSLPGFVLLAVGFWLVVPVRTSAKRSGARDGPRRRAARRLLATVTRRPVVLATGAMVCLGFVWQGFTAFLPTYLVEVKGIPQPTAATALGAFFVGGALVQPIAGNVADRYDERRILVAVATGSALALAAFPFADSALAFVALSVLASLQLTFWPIIFTYVPRALPDEDQGSGFGLLRTLFLYVGATGPIAVGALADVRLFDEAFLVLAAISVVAALLSAVLPRVER
jgi:MFS family permease